MSSLMEILGRAITVDTSDLIWHWLDEIKSQKGNNQLPQIKSLEHVISLASDLKIQAAQEQLRLYLFENPSCIYGRLAAAAICIRENLLQNAIEELNSVYLRQPNNTMALYALGHCYERLGQESQAVEFYQDCLKFKNYLQLPRQRLAAVYFKNRQLEKTIVEYELLKKEYPDDIATLITLGHLYIATAKYTSAIETFNTAILIHPDNFDANNDEIDQLVNDAQHYQAIEQIDQMLENQSAKPELLLKKADVLGMIGAVEESIYYYEQALALCPDFLEATIKLGTQYLRFNNEQLAAKQFNKAVEINDKIVDAYIGLALAQKLAGNISEALATLSLAAAIQPNSSLLFAQTASLQFKIGIAENMPNLYNDESPDLIESVITAHRNQIAHQPQNPDLHYRLGVLMMSVERITDAIQEFQTATTINPNFTRAKSRLAICLLESDRKTQALKQLVAPDCLNKDSLNLHYKTALLYCNKPKFASSLMNLEHYMESNFALTETVVNISIILQNLGLLDRASATWDNLADTAKHAINSEFLF
jgi:tetratricopeptide (TPR) repeat protein